MRQLATRPGLIGAAFQYFGARRALAPFVATVAYVAALGVRVDRGQGGRAWLLGALALACAYVAAGPSLPGNGLGEDGRRRVGSVAYALFCFALALASVDSNGPDLFQDLCGGLAALGSGVMAARGLSHIRGGEGIASSLPRPPRSLLGLTVGMLVTAFGLASFASVRSLGQLTATPWDPLPHEAQALAGGGALLVVAGSAWETLRMKSLALEAGDRARTALGAALAACAIVIGLLLVEQGRADRIARLSLATGALVVTFVCTEGDAAKLARIGRRGVTLLIFGGPVVLLGGLAAEGPGRSFPALLATGVAALVVGSVVSLLEQPLRRAEGRLLDAVEQGRLALVRADPEVSIRDALSALRVFAGPSSASPELWSFVPPRVLTIDGAGYPHERSASLPDLLVELSADEPEATLRAELLEALVVRRPDLRPLTRWMDERGALSATLVTREGEVEGVLVLPRGSRREPLSLEEVRAAKRLADAFSGALESRGALARSLERERLATKRADDAEDRLLAREGRDRAAKERDRRVSARLAEGTAGGPYAPAARVAYEAIERRITLGAPLVVLAPAGSDVVPYLARAHLLGPRGSSPFVVVDGAALQEHDLRRWTDAGRSPIALANNGLLILDDGARLPADVQRLLGDALAQRRAPWEGDAALDVTVALTGSVSAVDLKGSLDVSLALRLDEALSDPITWPHLRERGEDLRSLVLTGLVREGIRMRGAPLGIDDAAFAELANHSFPGEDAELRLILQWLAQAAVGDVVRVADVRSLSDQQPGCLLRGYDPLRGEANRGSSE